MIERWTEFLNEYLPEPWMRALAVLGSGILVGWIARRNPSNTHLQIRSRACGSAS